jgi:formate--tetrahydrofolate ligase
MPTVWAALRNCCAKLPFFAIKEDVCMKTDIEIAQEARMKPITQIAGGGKCDPLWPL